MSTYWPLYISASNVIDENNDKFLKRNRERKRKIPSSSLLIKSFSFDQTGAYTQHIDRGQSRGTESTRVHHRALGEIFYFMKISYTTIGRSFFSSQQNFLFKRHIVHLWNKDAFFLFNYGLVTYSL